MLCITLINTMKFFEQIGVTYNVTNMGGFSHRTVKTKKEFTHWLSICLMMSSCLVTSAGCYSKESVEHCTKFRNQCASLHWLLLNHLMHVCRSNESPCYSNQCLVTKQDIKVIQWIANKFKTQFWQLQDPYEKVQI